VRPNFANSGPPDQPTSSFLVSSLFRCSSGFGCFELNFLRLRSQPLAPLFRRNFVNSVVLCRKCCSSSTGVSEPAGVLLFSQDLPAFQPDLHSFVLDLAPSSAPIRHLPTPMTVEGFSLPRNLPSPHQFASSSVSVLSCVDIFSPLLVGL